MCLNDLSLGLEMADLTRNNLFPSAEEIASLSLQFAVPAGLEVEAEEKSGYSTTRVISIRANGVK